MTKIFISYSTEDDKEAALLHRLLSLFGFDCFLAHKDIRKGEKWREAIERELRNSEIFIALLSEHGVESPWVQQECGMAHLLRGKKKKPLIIPITTNGQDPPGCLSVYQAMKIGLTFWRGKPDIGHEVALKIGLEIVKQASCADEIKPKAISNIGPAGLLDYGFILRFLIASGKVDFHDFLSLLRIACSHPEAYRSETVMQDMYRLLKKYTGEFEKLPELVKAWNRLCARHQKYIEDERRLQEERQHNMELSMKKLLERTSNSK